MSLVEALALAMIATLCLLTLLGFPVAFTLGGVAIIFAAIGTVLGAFDASFLGFIPNRIYGVMTNTVLVAIPLFVFMGVLLERSRIAEELLESMSRLFGRLPGGLGLAVTLVGALLAASTGIVGATVVTMGLLSLPVMLRHGYQPALACGSIAAAGTLGQIIPPSIVLVILGDQMANAYQDAQRQLGNFTPEPVTVSDLFAGALLPGLLLVGLYCTYQVGIACLKPALAPAAPSRKNASPSALPERWLRQLLAALLAPLLLMIAVLGSILAGIATPTEAAAVGAIGAILLAGLRLQHYRCLPAYTAALSLLGVLLLTLLFDLRLDRTASTTADQTALVLAGLCCTGIIWGLWSSLRQVHQAELLRPVMESTSRFSAMVFAIIIGASLFSVVLRGFGGDELVHRLLEHAPGGAFSAMLMVMALMFVLGFFLDVIEIIYVLVPLVAPVLLQMDFNPVWLGVMFAINLQTSFLTPPLGYALFYLRSVAPPEIRTRHIYQGIIPFVLLQLIMLGLLALLPGLATWLPAVISG